MKKLKENPTLLYILIIAACFFYTGSAYMSQMYLLTDYYSDEAVDIITSALNYGLQALGMLLFMLGMKKLPSLFRKKQPFIAILATGTPFMAGMLLIKNGLAMCILGSVFNLFIGIYFGYYLTMLAAFVDEKRLGFAYGISYAVATVGTYAISLIGDSSFLVSETVVVLYIIFALLTIALLMYSEDIPVEAEDKKSFDNESKSVEANPINEENEVNPKNLFPTLKWLIIIVFLMAFVSSAGSGLYLALPASSDVNFTLTRAFYAIGLIVTGIIIDRSRQLGGLLTLASLTYPLIATSLLSNGENGTLALCISYMFLGFFAVYRVVAFADLGKKNKAFLPAAGLGLMIARFVDVIITILLFYVDMSQNTKLISTALIYSLTLVLFILFLLKEHSGFKHEIASEPALSKEALLARFSEKYGLTAREQEILSCIDAGKNDSEIAEQFFISKSTVRFHISNLMKKTGCTSRVEVVRKLAQEQ